jgi:hypothetical protein
MRWLYICLGILGALAPVGILYAVNYERRIPGAVIDLGLLLFSAGLSILFIPIGVTAGVVLAMIIHVVWNRALFGRTFGE